MVVVGGRLEIAPGYPYGAGLPAVGHAKHVVAMSTPGALRPGRTHAIQPIVAAIVTGALVGLIAAYQPIGAIGLVIAPVIAAIALYRLPLAVAMWIPLMFIEGLPGSRLAPELFGLFVGVGWVAALRLGTLNGAFKDARNLLARARGDAQLVRAVAVLGARSRRRRGIRLVLRRAGGVRDHDLHRAARRGAR